MKLSADRRSDAVIVAYVISWCARNSYCNNIYDGNYVAHHERPGKLLETDMASRSVVMPIKIGNCGMLRTAPKMDVHETAMLMEGVDLTDHCHVNPTRQRGAVQKNQYHARVIVIFQIHLTLTRPE